MSPAAERPSASAAFRGHAALLALTAAAVVSACGDSTGSTSPAMDGSTVDAGADTRGGSGAHPTDSGEPDDSGPDTGNQGPDDSGGATDSSSVNGARDSAGPVEGGSDATGKDAAPSDATSAASDAPAVKDAGRDADATIGSGCGGTTHSGNTPQASLPATPALTVPSGFTIQAIAAVNQARELAALPNGDLLVATSSDAVYLVPNAEASSAPGAPIKFTTLPESPAQGITFVPSTCTIYVATEFGIYAMAYVDAQQTAAAGQPIAKVRTGSVAPGTDGDVHHTTAIAFGGGKLYAGVGSSCNACAEVDPTRATVQVINPDGTGMTTRATRFRNAIALATNPATGTLWAGGAGQDDLPTGHPYEFFDAVTLHAGVADYGWPDCEENQHAYTSGASCASTVAPLIELPAYSTTIGATFYPPSPTGAHAFSTAYRGGVFLAAHGSWHQSAGRYIAAPRVVFVPMSGDTPTTPVDWTDPTKQWSEFVGGFQLADGTTRIGRPTGVAVGAAGSLFVADDQSGKVYRIRTM